jgi:hypothetical protein
MRYPAGTAGGWQMPVVFVPVMPVPNMQARETVLVSSYNNRFFDEAKQQTARAFNKSIR